MKNKIFLAGHNGMIGSFFNEKLKKNKDNKIFTFERKDLDLTCQKAVNEMMENIRPDQVIIAAAKVGGINANNIYPAEFIYENLSIQTNIIHAAFLNDVKKLLFLGSSCIYPKYSKQPISESELLGGYLERTNEAYAIAKIAGLKMCEFYKKQYNCNFISVMPTNLYGPRDNFNLQNAHVIPALIRKFHEAKVKKEKNVEVWGSGSPRREFMFVEDCVDACLMIFENYSELEHINIGVGYDYTIKEVAEMIKEVIGFKGKISFNLSKPDGTPQKLLNNSKLKNLGWKPKQDLKSGILETYKWFQSNIDIYRS